MKPFLKNSNILLQIFKEKSNDNFIEFKSKIFDKGCVLNQKNIRIFVFFAIILFWGYFSFPIEILQIKEADGAINYGYTPNAQAYIKSYFITLLLTACSAIIGVVVGFSLAILHFSKIKVLNFIIDEYIDIIRGTL